MSSPSTSTPAPRLDPGSYVITPSGAIAEIISVNREDGEAYVKWANGETAHMRLKLLRPHGGTP